MLANFGIGTLVARPIAHRGLHDETSGVIENTPSAVSAAVCAGYAVEVDLQITADHEAVVYHDAMLGRLTEGEGRLAAMQAADLKRVPFKATADRMMTLGELLDLVAGRVPIFLELKSQFDGDVRLPRRVAQALTNYEGPIAAMSFDPHPMRALRDLAPALPRGIVAERLRSGRTVGSRDKLAYLVNGLRGLPQFIAYNVRDLPAAGPLLARSLLGIPLLTWTVRSQADRERAARWADQMIFEGFRP